MKNSMKNSRSPKPARDIPPSAQMSAVDLLFEIGMLVVGIIMAVIFGILRGLRLTRSRDSMNSQPF